MRQDTSKELHQRSSFENIIFHLYVFETTQTHSNRVVLLGRGPERERTKLRERIYTCELIFKPQVQSEKVDTKDPFANVNSSQVE